MSSSLKLSNLHFHDARIVNSSFNHGVLKVSFEHVLNLIKDSNIPVLEIEFFNIDITKIKKDYGNGSVVIQEVVTIQDFLDVLELKPYVYELIDLEPNKPNYYEIFLDRSKEDYLPMIYFTFDKYRIVL